MYTYMECCVTRRYEGRDKTLHPTVSVGCNYLSMPFTPACGTTLLMSSSLKWTVCSRDIPILNNVRSRQGLRTRMHCYWHRQKHPYQWVCLTEVTQVNAITFASIFLSWRFRIRTFGFSKQICQYVDICIFAGVIVEFLRNTCQHDKCS